MSSVLQAVSSVRLNSKMQCFTNVVSEQCFAHTQVKTLKQNDMNPMNIEMFRRIVPLVASATQELWKGLRDIKGPLSRQKAVAAIANAVFSVWDPRMIKLGHALNEMYEQGSNTWEVLTGLLKGDASTAEIINNQAVPNMISVRLRLTGVLMGEVLIYIERHKCSDEIRQPFQHACST